MKGCSFDNLRACLHGSGGPQVGEVTRLGGVKKKILLYMQPYNPAIAGVRSRDYWLVVKHVNKKKYWKTTCFGD